MSLVDPGSHQDAASGNTTTGRRPQGAGATGSKPANRHLLEINEYFAIQDCAVLDEASRGRKPHHLPMPALQRHHGRFIPAEPHHASRVRS
jgi:hypothetical protein